MRKWRIVLHSSQIRKHNAFLRNWANRTESDELAQLIMDTLIRGNPTRITMKGM